MFASEANNAVRKLMAPINGIVTAHTGFLASGRPFCAPQPKSAWRLQNIEVPRVSAVIRRWIVLRYELGFSVGVATNWP